MVTEASQGLTQTDLLTLGIAAYAAIISTFVLGWDAYKWLASGARINISASTNMQYIGGNVQDDKHYISITAYNVGDQPTTITNLGGMYFDSWWRAFITRRKPVETFIITEPSQGQRIPYRFEIGDQWIGMAEQDEDIIKKAKSGYLFFILYTTGSKKGHWVRVKPPKNDANE